MSWIYQINKAANGPALVFFHGWGSDSNIWRHLRKHLGGEHQLVDLPGFGFKQDEPAPPLESFIQALGDELPEACVLIGWSLGGMIATRLAAQFPQKVKALVTLACNPSFVARDTWPMAMSEAAYQDFRDNFAAHPIKTWTRFCALQNQGDRNQKALTALLRTQKAPEEQNYAGRMTCLHWLAELDNRDSLSALTLKPLCIFGAQDALCPVSVAEALPSLVDADVRVLEDISHALPVSEPQRIAVWIRDHLKMPEPLSPFRKYEVAQSFGASAGAYDSAATVQAQIALRMLTRMPLVGASPDKIWLDLGCGTGYVSQFLKEQNKDLAGLVHMDIAEHMVHKARSKAHAGRSSSYWLAGDAEQLPLADGSLAAVLSSLMLQWCFRSLNVFKEIQRSLEPSGWLLFSTLGPDTLCELKQAWRAVDNFVHVNEFKPVENLKRELQQAGFVEIDIQRFPLQLEYSELLPLLKNLKAIGAHNMNVGRNKGLTTVNRLRRLEREYEKFRVNGKLLATYDVVICRCRKAKKEAS